MNLNVRRNKMEDEQIKKIIDSTEPYDQKKEDGLMVMVGDFYTRKMLSTVILVWSMGLIFMAGAVYCGIKFFKTSEIQYQIMYAVIFLTCIQWVSAIKVFAWQMIHRKNIKREIKRLELRIAELTEVIKSH